MEPYASKDFEDILTQDSGMLEILNVVRRVAKTASNVLITGESGTGKELIARAIHRLSPRSTGPFIPLNCGAIPQELLESELMGYEKGAFTGAISRKLGDFESANGGTIFLDEISTLSLPLQAKLLRILQQREIKRLGSNRIINLDVRVIAATNEDLEERTEKGLFRYDLFFRLNVVPVHVIPLRQRIGDIPLLLDHFILKACLRLKRRVHKYSLDVLPILQGHSWPGNVREFENMVERIIVLAEEGEFITIRNIPPHIVMSDNKRYHQGIEDFAGLRERCMVYEKTEIMKALYHAKWNRGKAANLLKIHRNTLILKMRKFNIPFGIKEQRNRRYISDR